MTDIFVDYFSYALGDDTNTVEQAADRGRTVSGAEVLKEAGFIQHHPCRKDTRAYDLAYRSVEKLTANLADVGAIIYSTCVPVNANTGDPAKFQQTGDVKHLMDFPASHLQSDFNLNDATVIGLNQQACTSMLGSLRLAGNLLKAEPELKRALCVTADRFPEGALYEQSYNLISDGAAACIVSLKPAGFKLLACHAVTNGAMAMASDDETVGSFFNYSHSTIQDTLKKANLTISDIRWIVSQNTNKKAWQILASLLRFDFSSVYFPTLPEVAHVISGDNIINLKRLVEEDKVRPGEKILLFMAGYGLNWQCVILERI